MKEVEEHDGGCSSFCLLLKKTSSSHILPYSLACADTIKSSYGVQRKHGEEESKQHLPRPPPTVMIAFESGDVVMMMIMVLAMR
jgi:hypothetical protein